MPLISRKTLPVVLIIALGGGLLALAILPGAPLLGLLYRVLAHAALTVPVALLLAGALWLALRGRRLAAALLVVLAVGATGLYGLRLVDRRYPRNLLTSPSAPGKVARLLLGKDLLLSDYDPQPVLKVERVLVERARYPAIDVHFHLASLEGMDADDLVRDMDSLNVSRVVNLDGTPQVFERFAREFRDKYPDRIVLFARLDAWKFDDSTFPARHLAWMDSAAAMGARGLKVGKNLGLFDQDEAEGGLVAIDDPRLGPIWDKAAALGWPVLMHVSDPTPFFQPVDRHNERFEELGEYPEWSVYGERDLWNPKTGRAERALFPPKDSLMAQRERLVARWPKTTFIMAHVGDNGEDLAYAARLMDRYPNYYVDISSRVPELGRQPIAARAFLVKYQDRILFGTDGGYALGTTAWNTRRFYRAYFEFLETANEYIEYPLQGINKQGRWRVYGVSLPDSVLRKLYHDNAARLIRLP